MCSVSVESMINEYMETIGYLDYGQNEDGSLTYKHKQSNKQVKILVEELEEKKEDK